MEQLPNIVRKRLNSAPAGDHPDPDLLTAFAEQALPDQERTRVLLHLARCADCRDVLALAVPPVVAASGALDTGRTVWFRWPILRWGAAAACVVIVGSAVLIKHDSMMRSTKIATVQENPRADRLFEEQSRQSPQPAAPFPERERAYLSADNEPTKKKFAASAQVGDQELGRQLEGHAVTKVPSKSMMGQLPGGLAGERRGPTVGGALDVGAAAGRFSQGPMAYVPKPTTVPKVEAKSTAPQEQNSNEFAVVEVPKPPESVAVQATANSVNESSAPAAESYEKREAPGKAKASTASAMFDAMKTPAAMAAPSGELDAKQGVSRARAERVVSQRSLLSRWTISSDGQLQHSVDSGQTWQPVVVAEKATFRALSANGPDVWVGGAAGLLYHSIDAGAHWTQVKPTTADANLTADIAAIEFTDFRRGKITTSTGESWITEDGGQSWRK